jgi:hypothetical protein
MQRVTVDSATNAVGDDGVVLAIVFQRLHPCSQRARHQDIIVVQLAEPGRIDHPAPEVQSGRKVSVLQGRHTDSTVRSDVLGEFRIVLPAVDDHEGHSANALL